MSFVDNLNFRVARTPNSDGTDDLSITVKEDDGDVRIKIPMELLDEIVAMRMAQLIQSGQLKVVQKRTLQKYMDQMGCDSLCRLRGRATIEERKHNEEKRILREKKRIIKDVLEKQLLEELDRQEKEEAEKALKEKETNNNGLPDKNDIPKIDTKSNTKS